MSALTASLPKPEPPIVLLDTNVWIDRFIATRPRNTVVSALISWCLAHDVSLAYASQSALDVYYQVMAEHKTWWRRERPLTEDVAKAIKRLSWDCVNLMQSYATAIPQDSSDIYLACKLRDYHDDLEDDLIISACRRAKASFLVTSDRKLLAHANVCAKEPADMLELLRNEPTLQ